MKIKNQQLIMVIATLFLGCQTNVKKNIDTGEDYKIQEIKSHLTEQVAKDSLHGVALIGKNDKIILHEAYGYVDLDSLQRHTIKSEIGLASLGKMFTAISIMQLESIGKLNLEDLASKHLTNIDNEKINNRIKIKHLLSHTSGMGDYSDELGIDNNNKDNELEDIYSIVKNDTLLSQVGKKFIYSNSGYIILGKIIEKITKTSYREYVQKNILDKCEMNSTKIGLSDGGGSTTSDNLWKFSQAIRDGLLIDKKHLDIMTKKQSNEDYGYGFKLKNLNGSKIYGHTGGFWIYGQKIGVASGFDIINNKYTVIILTNRNPSLGGAKARDYLLEIMTEK